MTQIDYSRINEEAFDFLADSYRRKSGKMINPEFLVEKFSQYLSDTFSNPNVLEIGVGSGDILRYFSERGFRTTAIDISSRMIEVAGRKSPNTTYIHSDFLEHNFDNRRFSGIFANSVLHLFPKRRTREAFDKIYSILKEGGFFYLSIPLFNESREEVIKRGDDDYVQEFRTRYIEKDFTGLFNNSAFGLLEKSITEFVDSKGNSLSRLNALLIK